ncbi:MAG: protein-L-isoaspartate(D-aspartate) O-methyltransferase [Candidatus Omnitrophica bacterium]|nr:protein-L-isoaspartate(D-aspartate) O-methyltransferase [Candidatus Omnitrophota bacterium]
MVTILVFIISIVFFWVSEGIAFDYAKARNKMIKEQIISRGVKDQKVISAMEDVERHLFVPSRLRERAYDDGPLPIGYSQTISQPYIVAFMSEALNLEPEDIVLEIGTGSGYQAAILAEIVKKVYTIEILEPLAGQSRDRLKDLGYDNIEVKHGDGYLGWPEHAPFDKIIVTAAPSNIPMELVGQLKIGGKMVIPIGSFFQELYLITKTKDGFVKKALLPVRFVPMVKGK